MRQPELRVSGPAGQHQRGADLICGELIRNGHAHRLVSRADTAQPDLDHSGHQLGSVVIHLPIPRLEHLHAIETGQPGEVDSGQYVSQPRPGGISVRSSGITWQPDMRARYNPIPTKIAAMYLSGPPSRRQEDVIDRSRAHAPE
jgi:hypothetical protein